MPQIAVRWQFFGSLRRLKSARLLECVRVAMFFAFLSGVYAAGTKFLLQARLGLAPGTRRDHRTHPLSFF